MTRVPFEGPLRLGRRLAKAAVHHMFNMIKIEDLILFTLINVQLCLGSFPDIRRAFCGV
jgi:hypothetical protein